MKPTFERCADATLGKVRDIYAERGAMYSDSWAAENVVETFTRDTFLLLKDVKPEDLTKEHMRLIQAAVLVDIKDSRMAGGYRADHLIDGVAYRAIYGALREEYEAAHRQG